MEYKQNKNFGDHIALIWLPRLPVCPIRDLPEVFVTPAACPPKAFRRSGLSQAGEGRA